MINKENDNENKDRLEADDVRKMMASLPPEIRNKLISGFIKQTMGIDANVEAMTDLRDNKGNFIGSIGIASKQKENQNMASSWTKGSDSIVERVSRIQQKDENKKIEKEQMIKFRDLRIEDLKRILGKERTDELLREEERILISQVEHLTKIRKELQNFENDFRQNTRRIEDITQFIDSERHILYNLRNTVAHVNRVFADEMNEVYHNITELFDTMEMTRMIIPLIRIETEVDNQKKFNSVIKDAKKDLNK